MKEKEFADDLAEALEVASYGGMTELSLVINGTEVVVVVKPKSMKEEN